MASTRNFVLDKGYDASGAIPKGRAVKFTGTPEQVTLVTAEGYKVVGVSVFGVTTDKIARGKCASIAVMGAIEMEAGGAINEGDLVGIDGTGRAVVANTGSRIIGFCREGVANAGEFASVHLNLPGTVSA